MRNVSVCMNSSIVVCVNKNKIDIYEQQISFFISFSCMTPTARCILSLWTILLFVYFCLDIALPMTILVLYFIMSLWNSRSSILVVSMIMFLFIFCNTSFRSLHADTAQDISYAIKIFILIRIFYPILTTSMAYIILL